MATIETRLENAERRASEEKVRPIRLGEAQYLVASSSHPGGGYLVHLDSNGDIHCTCPAAQWEFPCKHATAVGRLRRRAMARVA